ncbi:serine/threonine-protein kinase [Leptolyngbya ohadii]|uniref:protein kinase domain-containing protein n=1 Tax=Leptolyngbya ohadii TaxID=1962290 RepID=UPI000B5A00DD
MEVYCTRPSCPRPLNHFADLDNSATLKTIPQKYCTACGLELLLAGRYFAVKLLGQGGFGTAYLARDRYTPAMRFCVVKQFQPSTQLTSQQLEIAQNLFEREGQVLEELGTHPQIPDLLAFFALPVTRRYANDPDQFFYLVQEFIDGQNLEQELEQQGRFSEAKTLALLESLLPVLQFVHDRGSIHRDIKPSNIMRRKDGTLFLLDFGAVKQATASNPGQAQSSSTGIYSQGFAPPEQMKGNQVYPATDLYALAVTCLMLLTREQPQDLYDTYKDEWSWHSHVKVSDRLATVLDKMLMLTPSHNSGTAGKSAARAAIRSRSRLDPSRHQTLQHHAPQGWNPLPAGLWRSETGNRLQSRTGTVFLNGHLLPGLRTAGTDEGQSGLSRHRSLCPGCHLLNAADAPAVGGWGMAFIEPSLSIGGSRCHCIQFPVERFGGGIDLIALHLFRRCEALGVDAR